ncbi:MFS transporter [Natrialbaceae archaeon A-gly3]
MADLLPNERGLSTKVVLSIGFLAVALATLYAHASPASGYELSIYSGTPSVVWAGLSVAFVVSLTVAFWSCESDADRGLRAAALGLGGLAITVFVALPIVRGYHYFGTHDALTHLGWTRAIREGSMSPFELGYPGIHTLATLVSSVTGIPIQRSVLFAVFLTTLVFVVFIPLCVGAIVDDPFAVTIATFGAVLLLPITTLATHLSAHPMTQAVFFSALFVYLLTTYVLSSRRDGAFTAGGVALAVASVAAVVYHPQLSAHLIVALLGICLVQYVGRRGGTESPIGDHQPLYGHTLLLIVAFLVWTSDRGFYVGTLEYVIESAMEYVLGTGESELVSQGASLSAIGVGVEEIFFKLFFPHLIFTILSLALLLAVLVRVVPSELENIRAVTVYFSAGLVGLSGLFGIYFVESGSDLEFRVFGLIMVFAVVLGSLALYVATTRARTLSPKSVNVALAICFGGLLVLSLLAIFPSPYIYSASPHVTETQMSGYETAFENQNGDLELMGLRNGPNRHHDAVYGNADRMRLYTGLPETALEEPLSPQYESDQYLVLTAADHEREVSAYHELRYSQDELSSVTNQQGVDRVQSNPEFDLYLIRGAAESEG